MSRIGKKYITIPDGVKLTMNARQVVIHGPKGQLEVDLPSNIEVILEDNLIKVKARNHQRQTNALHGLVRSLLFNAVFGVNQGYKKTLKLHGTGYRVATKGKNLQLSVGYSHPVDYAPPAGVDIKIEGNNTIVITGIDKQQVGQVAANIRKIKPPDAYKGKGIRYDDEQVKTKPGKTTSS